MGACLDGSREGFSYDIPRSPPHPRRAAVFAPVVLVTVYLLEVDKGEALLIKVQRTKQICYKVVAEVDFGPSVYPRDGGRGSSSASAQSTQGSSP